MRPILPGFAILWMTLLVTLPGGCAIVGRDYEPPQIATPSSWYETATGLASNQPADLKAWWKQLGDPMLDQMVARAATEGLDLREAFARVAEARATRGVATAARMPSLDVEASWNRQGDSGNTPFGAFAIDWTRYAVRADAAWELDLWGRVQRSVEAARADLEATVEDARDIAVSVAAETALAYVNLRAFQARLAIARTNVELQGQTLALVRGRFDAGLVGERDVAQARTNVETTRARVPTLEAGLRAAEHRLAALIGAMPGTLPQELAAVRAIPVPPVEIAVGVPADLLRRRADVRRAERELAAATARIGVAEGDLYPRLSLSGNIGIVSDSSSTLFDSTSLENGFGPSIRWNLFDGGRLRQLVDAEEARTAQALVRWERTVILALEETENAMTAFVREQVRRGSLRAAVDSARNSVRLAQAQYRQGITDFQAVLDSERALAELEDALSISDAAVTANFIAVYKALGGGWESMAAARQD